MMIDNNLRVSSAQAVTSTAVSADKVDLSVARDIGEGQDLFFSIVVTETAASAGATTVEFQAVVSDSDTLSSPVVVGSSGAIGKAALVAGTTTTVGTMIMVRINPQVASLGKRYLGVNYVVATGPLTAGKFTADLVTDIQDGRKAYASGYAVL